MSKDETSISSNEIVENFSTTIGLIEKLHRLFLDVLQEELERQGCIEVSPIQAALLFKIGKSKITAGELRAKGYYQGSNISYNLKKLLDSNHLEHVQFPVDRRSIRIKLTKKGLRVAEIVEQLVQKQSSEIKARTLVGEQELKTLASSLSRIEHYWQEQKRRHF